MSLQNFSQLIISIELCMSLSFSLNLNFFKQFRSYMLKLIYIFDHVLIAKAVAMAVAT